MAKEKNKQEVIQDHSLNSWFLEQAKARRHYKLAFLLVYAFNLALAFMSEDRALFFASLVAYPIAFLIVYICSIKADGYRWLTWVLICIPLNFLKELKEEISDIANCTYPDEMIYFLIIFLLYTSVIAYYWIRCSQLREINKKIYTFKKLSVDK